MLFWKLRVPVGNSDLRDWFAEVPPLRVGIKLVDCGLAVWVTLNHFV
jgi:hypothetical protein